MPNINSKTPIPHSFSKNEPEISIKGCSLNNLQRMISEETQIENIKLKYMLSTKKSRHFKVILKKWRTPNGHDYVVHE